MNTSSRMNADAMSGKCGKGSGIGCFIAGTKVKTIEGDRNIEDIEVGDYVLAENVETGEQEYKEVTQTFTYEKTAIVHVYVGEEEIETTLEHPFYVEGLGFVSAGELQAGDIIRTSDGRNLPIKKIEIEELEETVTVYNFEVEDFHTYYVSELGVLVHNECPKTDFYVGPEGTATTSIKEYKLFTRYSKKGKFDYQKLFFEKNPNLKGKVVVHHALEQQVLEKYPGLFSAEEINSDIMLRGIPKRLNNSIHLSKIRKEWNTFYKKVDAGEIALSREVFLDKVDEIDDLYGKYFNPPQ